MRLTWPVILAPLMLVVYPLQNKVFKQHPAYWQLPEGVMKPFSTDFLHDNIGHAAAFLFNPDSNLPNSMFVAGLGLLAVAFLYVLALGKRCKIPRTRPEILVLSVFGLVIVANFSLLMCYHWGQLDRFEVWRLGLPLHLLMVFSIVVVLPEFSKKPALPRIACALAALMIYAHALPSTAKAAATRTAVPSCEVSWQAEFLQKHAAEDLLYICYSPALPIVFDLPGVSLQSVNQDPANVEYHMRVKSYSAFYLFQRFDVDAETGATVPVKGYELSDAFRVETVAEKSFSPLCLSRISRIVAVDVPPKAVAAGEHVAMEEGPKPAPGTEASAAGADSDPYKDPLFRYFLRLP